MNDGVGAIQPYAGGFVASVQNGLLWRWHEELGSCRTPYRVAPSQGGKGRYLYTAGDDLVVADVEGDVNVAGAVNWLDLWPRAGPRR